MSDAHEFVASGTATQRRRYVITTADSLENLHPDGAWISAANPMEIRQ